MEIDLKDCKLFAADRIAFDKQINFVYGKNGTGKTTLCKMINDQLGVKNDVNIFQGFEPLLSSDEKLNSVLLGEENVNITNEIKSLEDSIDIKEQEKKRIEQELMDTGEDNLYSKLTKCKDEWKKKKCKIEKFKTDNAKIIKNKKNPQIAKPTYNKNDIEQEIKNASRLEQKEIETLEELLKSEVKVADYIKFDENNFMLDEWLKSTNNLLNHAVDEEKVIKRLEDPNKRQFAEEGLKIHKAGEVCAFCGNIISEEVVLELKSYFDADKVKLFKENIENYKNELQEKKTVLEMISPNINDFYIDYQITVTGINEDIEHIKKEYVGFIDNLIDKLRDKESNLFNESEEINSHVPSGLDEAIKSYNNIVGQNNTSELVEKQENASKRLRYHYIQLALDKFGYDVECNELSNIEKRIKEFNIEVTEKQSKIGTIEQEINSINDSIKNLRQKTISEKLLAQNINRKLRNYVNFELVYCEDNDEIGYYQVKNIYTGEIREITKLSKGEKNIIAFLYFIQKLDDVTVDSSKDRIIVFDDPMTSNDETLQYVIISELQTLLKDMKTTDRFILLTHNSHLYVNTSWAIKKKNKYENNNFYRLISNGKNTQIIKIDAEENDLKTSYAGLWQDLTYLYKDKNARPEIMLNIIRRIIETYCKFNVISLKTFYASNPDAKKYFDVNSHSIDTLEMDLNGLDKEDIIKLMRQCFYNNCANNHFDSHWNR